MKDLGLQRTFYICPSTFNHGVQGFGVLSSGMDKGLGSGLRVLSLGSLELLSWCAGFEQLAAAFGNF